MMNIIKITTQHYDIVKRILLISLMKITKFFQLKICYNMPNHCNCAKCLYKSTCYLKVIFLNDYLMSRNNENCILYLYPK